MQLGTWVLFVAFLLSGKQAATSTNPCQERTLTWDLLFIGLAAEPSIAWYELHCTIILQWLLSPSSNSSSSLSSSSPWKLQSRPLRGSPDHPLWLSSSLLAETIPATDRGCQSHFQVLFLIHLALFQRIPGHVQWRHEEQGTMVGTEEDTWTPFVDWDTVPTEVF